MSKTTTLPSVCPLDCPDRCSLDVDVRGEMVTEIRGSRLHSLTGGFICSKVAGFAGRLYGTDRLLRPLRRSGPRGSGRFDPIPWEEAIAEIASRLRSIVDEYGGEAILPVFYGGSNGLMTQGLVDEHLFRRLGASRLARTVCAASTTAAGRALYGGMPGVAFEDYPEARFILIWGANPAASNIHLVPWLKKAKRRGAKIAAVDPRRVLGDELVDHRLQPWPGTDVVIALAMIRHLDEAGLADRDFLARHTEGWEELRECARAHTLDKAAAAARVRPGDIARMAEAYAEADPALIRCGWGLERNRNGLAGVAAVLALPAVAGKFGRRGGGYSLSSGGAYRVDGNHLSAAREQDSRIINMNQLGRVLTGDCDPPIKALFVYNCNPLITLPDQNRILQGLRRDDLFTVVFDQVMTDTAGYADVVLPATTFLEHTELSKSYGGYAVQLGEPVVAPRGEARPNAEVFHLIGRALGFSDCLFAESPEDLLQRATGALKGRFEAILSPELLRSRRIVHCDLPGRRPEQFVNVFPDTDERRIRLFSRELGPEPYRYTDYSASPEYPLALISPASSKSISSTLAEIRPKPVRVSMNPADARQRGLADGDRVRVFNELGEVHCILRLDDRLREGVASLPKGFWFRSSLNGSGGNALVPDSLTPVSGGACFNDARVEVEGIE